MAIKKNAAKADIGPKKQVKATFAECTAENPLKCKYHGLKAFDNLINQCLANHGMTAAFVTDKVDDGYELRFSPDTIFGKAMEDILNALHEKGLNLVFKGTHPETGALVYKAQENDKGIAYETPENEAELEDADTLSSSKAPENNTVSKSTVTKKDPFAELENMDVDALIAENELDADLMDNFDELDVVTAEATEDLEAELLGNSDYNDVLPEISGGENATPELTDEDIKKLVAINGVTESKFEEFSGLMDSYKAIITTGKNPSGNELTRGQKRWWKDLIEKASSANEDELPALKVLKETMKGIGALKESEAPDNAAQEEAQGQPFTDEEFKDALLQYYEKKGYNDPPTEEAIETWKKAALTVTMDGEPLNEHNQELLYGLAKTAGEESSVGKAIKESLAKLNPDKYGKKKSKLASTLEEKDAPDAVLSTEELDEKFTNLVDEALDSKMFDKKSFVAKYNKIMGIKNGGDLSSAVNMLEKLVHPPKKPKMGAKEALISALEKHKYVSLMSTSPITKQMLKPLEHDESKFPIGVTKEVLDKALSDSSAKALGGASGDHATLIVIDGRKYVCKKGSGSHAEHIHNEVLADQAYRAGGVRAPDCQEYVFGNYTYKLAEFIEGKSLSSYMASATAAQQEELRKDLLAGFPMDVLLSNWDVIGTSRDNIIVDADGHGWRIDNGGSFDMATMSNKKTMAWAVEEYINKPKQNHKPALAAFENWDNEGGWAHRQWIDDFRTMRVDPKNKGLFDQYSTAEIFLSAANVDFANAVSGLPQGLKDALAKPLFEMRAMAHQAWCAKEAGYSTAHSMTWKDANGGTHITPVDTMSAALDAIYEAHKDGCREWLQKKTGWGNLGWLSSIGNGTAYQKKAFPESAPPEPLPPPIGTDFTAPILTAIKSIHYHIKQGDYTPNETSLKKAIELKPILEMLDAENVEKAKGLLDAIHKIEDAAKDGYKKQLSFDTPDGMFDVKGLYLKFDSVHKAIFEKHNSQKHDEWKKNMGVYLAKKKVWDENEEKKAKAAGAAPEDSFGAYEDKLIKANIDTNGIPRGDGKPECNHESKEAQKDTSFSMESCKKKVRQYSMMGIPLEAMYFQNGDKIFYNGNTKNGGHHVSGYKTSEKDFFAAIDFYRQNPEIFRIDMESYARHKGMMALVHMNIENSAVDAKDGTVFVMRGEHKQAWGKDGAGKPTGKSRIIDRYPIDSSTSAQINNTGIMGGVHIGWKLPVWRISDNFMISTDGVNSGKDGEYEICINPIQIPYPPMYFSDADVAKGWEHCMGLYLNEPQIKGAQET